MNRNAIICFFAFILLGFSLNAQVVQFKSNADSLGLAITAKITNTTNKTTILYSDANGKIDFSGTEIGAIIEISSLNTETRIITYNTNIPNIIYLNITTQQVDEMIVTGQMQQTTIGNAVQTVRIISSKKIEQMGAQNLTQLFKNELNIRLSNDPILGTGMSLQGISGENVKILVDGVPVIGRLNGTIDLDQININNVERIEIIEGPLSVNYGSDALAGTINIITKTNYRSAFQSNAKVFYESNGTYNTQFNTAIQLKKTLISADINRNFFDGWRPDESNFHIEKERIADTNRTKSFKPREQIFGGIKLSQQLKTWETGTPLALTIHSNVFSEEILNRGTPTKPYYIKAFDEYYNTFRFDNSISIVGNIAKKWSINSTNAYNFYKRRKNTFSNDLTTLTETLTLNEGDQDTSVFDLFLSRTSFVYNHSKKWQLELGYDVNYESSRGIRIEGTEKAIGDYALYVTSEIKPVEKLIIKPGIRASFNSVYKSPIIPSIFFKYQLTKNNGLRFSYSRGFRAPSLKELYFFFVDINHNIQGNGNLKAEYSDNFQLALRTDYERGKCRLVITNQLFFNDLKNLITLAQVTPTEYSYVNLLSSQTYGYTLNTTFTRKQLSIELGGTVQGRQSQVSAENTRKYNAVYPEFKVNPSYTINKAQLTFAVYYKYTGKIPNFQLDTDGNVYSTNRQDFHMLDVTASSKIWKERLGISMGVKNVLNVTTINGSSGGGEAHSSGSNFVQIGMGRTYFCALTISLKSKANAKK